MKRTLLLAAAILMAFTGLFAQLQFNPVSLDFGQRPLTSATNLEVILTSQINQLISLSDLPAPFSASPDEFMISIGEQKSITITFHPMTVGSFAQTLTATGSIWGTAHLQVYGQSGAATVSFSEAQHWFGEVLMTSHAEHIITITSNIAQQVGLSGLNLPFEANRSMIDLLPNQPEQVIISFNPIIPGYFEDYLDAVGSISGSHQIVLNGVSTQASIYAFPQSLNFEPLFSGQTDTLEIIVTTDINQDISLSGLSGVFSVFPDTLTLVAGEAQSVFVSFAPVNPGNFSQSLYLAGSVWGGINIPVYGECIDPQISVSPAQVDFGTIPLLTSSTNYVTVYNTGNGMLECEVANDNPHFTVSPEALSISQGSSQSVAITFVPDFVPAEYDTLLITSNDPDTPLVKVPLQGQGMSQVSGEVCGTWYKANSPYNFTGSVTVPESCTLTIEPGVVVNMGANILNVYGNLICNGLPNDSIYFNGSGTFQLSSYFAANIFDYVVINCPSGTNGFINSNGLSLKNSNLKNYTIWNHNKSAIIFDDFNDWLWADKWIETNPTFGDTYVNSDYYWHSSPYLEINTSNVGNNYGIVSKPFVLASKGAITLELEYRVSVSNINCNTQFFWRVNKGNWDIFYETPFNSGGYWNFIKQYIDYDFEISDSLELMILNNVNGNYWNNQLTQIDNVKIIYSSSNLEISNSKLNLSSIDNYSTDVDTVPSMQIDHSTFRILDGIKSQAGYSSIEMKNSEISRAGGIAIAAYGAYSEILLDSVTIQNAGNCGIFTQSGYSGVKINNSSISKCSATGVYTNSSNSPVTVKNSSISINNSDGIYTQGPDSPITIDHSEITNNHKYGVYSTSTGSIPHQVNQSNISGNSNMGLYVYGQLLLMNGSIVSNNGSYGVYSSNAFIENSVVSSNQSEGIYANNIYGNYLTSVYNQGKGIIAGGSDKSYLFNSIVCLNAQYVAQFSGNFEFLYCKINGDPQIADSLGHLLPNSPCVDAADPSEEDARIPYGMGTVRADMGAYGGPENWVWGGEPIPTNGEPDIVHIVDIPQDQGKKVGIQFSASLFDNRHPAYKVTRYSFWRELDENGKMPLEASKTPVGQFFQKGPNYWEYVGEMPANGFANYGYSAPTLGDSTINGMFWSKFLVVAHTNDSDIYWVSQPDSGYSVDNLAPATPLNLAGTVAGVTYNLQWTPSPDEDLQYYAVYKSVNGLFGEKPFATTTQPEFPDILLNLEEQDFAVAAFDFSGNRSALSPPLTSPVFDMLAIPQGWSGISSWIGPEDPSLEDLFAPASTDLIILQNMQGVYWPGQNVNTLGAWDEGKGYIVKMAQEAQVPFIGIKNPENHFQLSSGWQILPVLSNCPLPLDELQNQLGSNLLMVKEIAGWRVFWPAMGISTLETLEPGKAYFLNTLTGNGQVVFGECE